MKARLRLCELSSTLREHETALRYCREVAERALVVAEGEADLFEVVLALHGFRLGLGFCHRRQEQTGQDRDDRDDDQ